VPRTRLATIARGCEIHVAAPRVRMVELGTSETLTAAHRTASAFSADETLPARQRVRRAASSAAISRSSSARPLAAFMLIS